ncbi:type II toxin-antitoxin system PemK/MazF family toxin [Aquipuribacter nitratireducens]|uniref:Type II toxin-antitoxin system PemK/MazF family toxin n=1 Tax=Aquipuribacter nitratireducens TaxID=650104 RepID=A0ABW0GIF0_9MICO
MPRAGVGLPRRGDIWHLDLGTPIGHEAGARRFALVVSVDAQNRFGLAAICPITTTALGYPSHVEIDKGTAGMSAICYVQVEQLRTVSTDRFETFKGVLDPVRMNDVEQIMRWVLGLGR